MFCPNCGTKVPENQAFCSSCGTKVAGIAEAPKAPVEKKDPVELIKSIVKNDKLFVFRVAVFAFSILAILLLFSKGIGIHTDGGNETLLYEWDYYFKNCGSSKAIPIVLQVISMLLIAATSALAILPMFLPQLSKIKFYNLFSGAAAVLTLIIYLIMLITALAIFEGSIYYGVHPASASWFYIADMIAIIVTSVKMFKADK